MLVTNSTIDANTSGVSGGGILNEGALTIEYSTISNNNAQEGGGLDDESMSSATMITGSYFFSNSATTINFGSGDGGGIFDNNMLGIIINSTTMNKNKASFNGGGVWAGGPLNMTNSTVTQNSAAGSGGGIYTAPEGTSTTLILDTISSNTGGGVVQEQGGSTSATATIFAKNTPNNCTNVPTTDNGFNLSDDDSCTFTSSTLSNTNPKLGALAPHGGPTLTEALSTGSPAIDAANTCGVPNDQRGFIRPVGSACDIGAFEVQTSTVKPTCKLLGLVPGGIQVKVTDGTAGGTIGVNEITATELTNATITTSPAGSTMFSMAGDSSFYSPPTTTGSVTVTAVKVNSSLSSQLGLKIVNNVGNTVSCDPTLIEVVDGKGKQLDHINGTEHFLTIVNDGVNAIHMKVNGRNVLFHENSKAKGNDYVLPKDGATGHYNIGKYLRAGNNKLVISASGKPRGTATLLFSDSAPQH